MVKLLTWVVIEAGGQSQVDLTSHVQGAEVLINQENVAVLPIRERVNPRLLPAAAKHQPTDDWVGALLEFH